MQEQVTHVRCPACRSTVKAFDTHCWVCGSALAAAAPREQVVIDAATQDVAPAAEHGFDAIARRIAHLAPPGAQNASSQALIPVGPLRTINERTYFRRPPGTPRQPANGPFLLPEPAARTAHLAPPTAHARRNSAVQPLMAVAAMVFMSVAAMTFVGRYAPTSASAEVAGNTARPLPTLMPATATGISSLVAIDVVPAATATSAATRTATRIAPTATVPPTASPTPRPAATTAATATAIPSPTAAPAAGGATTYLVKSGDSCSEIARAFDISLASLIEANKLDARCRLLAGQTLTIPAVNR